MKKDNMIGSEDSNNRNLKWKVPYYIIIAIFVFLLINSITILNVRGIVDKEGYLWNNSYSIPINRYEDDGGINVYAALGYFKNFSEKFACLINIGGPYIHIARFLLWVGSKTGIVKIFEDPFTYYIYPQEYLRIWKFYGLYKLFLLVWMPLGLYWIGVRHFSKLTGILAVLLITAIPFITGFETRLKADGIAIMLALFSLLWQLEYISTRKIRDWFIAAVFLGFSFSVKFNLLPALVTFFTAYYIVNKKGENSFISLKSWLTLLKGFGILSAVFILANPFFLLGVKAWFKSIISITVIQSVKEQPGINIITMLTSVINAVWYRIKHFDSLMGGILNWLVMPVLFFALISMFMEKGHRRIARGFFLFIFISNFIYYAFLKPEIMIYVTYYFYAATVILIILISDFFSFILEKVVKRGRIATFMAFGIGLIYIFIISATWHENIRVIKYMTSNTNRQEMCNWFEKNIPKGSVVGIPMAPTHTFFNQWIRLDPFKYHLVHIGNQAEILDKSQPDYFIWILFSKNSPVINDKDYRLIAVFSKGTNLPHERYDLYQEEEFQVYKRIGLSPDISQRNIQGQMEYELGEEMSKDKEREFRILQFQSISFMPVSLNLLRKIGQTVEQDSYISFDYSINVDKLNDFKYMNVQNIGPTVLQMWGVKYILAKLNMGSSFEEQVLKSSRYNLKEIKRYKTVFGDEKRDVGLYYNNEYIGQVFFVQYKGDYISQKETRGILNDLDRIKKLNTNNVAIFMDIKSNVPVNIIIRGGGNEELWNIGRGKRVVWRPYRIFNHDESIAYEINPIEDNGKIDVKEIYAIPFFLYGEPSVDNVKITRESGLATVNVNFSGDVIFSLPYDKYWEAKVDGVLVPVKMGLAGTIAIEITRGKHLVEVHHE